MNYYWVNSVFSLIKNLMFNIDTAKKAIGITDFKKIDLLEIALTHPSFTNENLQLSPNPRHQQERKYRRLAHLGDAIYGAIVTDYLYHNCPEFNQAALHELKISLVDKKKLSEFA